MSLLPCPFCGDPGDFISDSDGYTECQGCGAQGPYSGDHDKEEMRQAWNSRRFPLQWKEDSGPLAHALMGASYDQSPRNIEVEAIIGDAIDSGQTLRQVVDLISCEAQSPEELVCMIYALGVFDGRKSR